MIEYFLKIDYCLSQWFARKDNQTALNGAIHIFLTKIGFVSQTIYFIVLPILPVKLGINIAVVGIMLIVAVVMYGFPKKIKKLIKTYGIINEYKRTSLQQRKNRNFMGILYLIFFFTLMFYIGVICFEGYAYK